MSEPIVNYRVEKIVNGENNWCPASGYRTVDGKSKWRCWNGSRPSGHKEHLTANGRAWTCDSVEAAKRKCAELNAIADLKTEAGMDE